MKNNLILETAHLLLSQVIGSDDIVIDATMGNGHDTLFLAQHAKHVYAFDIQEKALRETQKKIESEQLTNITLIHDSHEHFSNYLSTFKGAIFNLGYLPNGDKKITTQPKTTIKTIDFMLKALHPSGFIQVVVYRGHEAGEQESVALTVYLKTLDTNYYKVLKVDLPFQDNLPPYIYMVYKAKDESH